MLTRFSACVQSGDNSVDSVDLRGLYGFQHPQRTEPRSAPAAQLVAGEPGQLVERLADRVFQQHGRGVGIGVRAIGWLRDDRVDDAELEAVDRVGFERGGGLLGLPASRQRIAAQPSGEITE